jgi:hypothetical protein
MKAFSWNPPGDSQPLTYAFSRPGMCPKIQIEPLVLTRIERVLISRKTASRLD